MGLAPFRDAPRAAGCPRGPHRLVSSRWRPWQAHVVHHLYLIIVISWRRFS